ncbi:uncharacterized protein LOC109836256 [Asparagus officinalis]|uniref:uncharacterized protein LOC109836256 n=1 Tax=Asparagus officinalis TaxID=4686 RepID=UPI00098E2952|nr:uncharacterized protein LOC109836256 [Asparagus officinalis]
MTNSLDSSSSGSKHPVFHPAFAVSNINNHIKLTLDTENVHYAHWTELFINTAKSFDVADHIVIPKDSPPVTTDAQWERLDAIVKQWIYSTISPDLLHTIITPGATAKETWDRLADIFQDNKHSRTVFLEQEFTRTHMDQFQSISAYCQALKMLADQLANVGTKISDDRLVLQLVTGLSIDYATVATIIEQSNPLPSFYKARSMLLLEETRRNRSISTGTALVAASRPSAPPAATTSSPPHTSSRPPQGRGRGGGGRGGRFQGGRGRGKAHWTSKSNASSSSTQPPPSWTWVPFNQWTAPPCPYPTTGWAPRSTAPGLLGQRPQQAFVAQSQPAEQPSGMFVPTTLAEAMHTLSLTPPDDDWYMDTGATSHMTSDQGPSDGDTADAL